MEAPRPTPKPLAGASASRLCEDPESELHEFPCTHCGARTTWDPDADALLCAHCGTATAVPRREDRILEHSLEAAGVAARGLGLETRTSACQTCGASVAFGEVATAVECVFCGSSNVLARESNRNALRPESLIPLDVGRAAVEQGFRRWLEGLWFRPNALKRLERFEAVGVYVPYWTFDARVQSTWSADSGTYYWTTQVVPVYVNGKLRMRTRQVRKVRWRPAWGEREDRYDDHLFNASGGIPDDLAAKLGGFDTTKLVPYRPEYLAGLHAEEYRVDLEQSWECARDQLAAQQRARCAGDIPGDTYRSLRAAHAFDSVRWKLVLLPMWTLRYRHGGKSYTVLVHGQTGRVHGRAPWSWVKLLLLVPLAVGLVLLLIALIAL